MITIPVAKIAVAAAIAAASFATGSYESWEDGSWRLGKGEYTVSGRMNLPIDPQTGVAYTGETRSLALLLPGFYRQVEVDQTGNWSMRGPATDAEMRAVYGCGGYGVPCSAGPQPETRQYAALDTIKGAIAALTAQVAERTSELAHISGEPMPGEWGLAYTNWMTGAYVSVEGECATLDSPRLVRECQDQ